MDPAVPVGRAADAARSVLGAWRQLEGRLTFALRQDPELRRLAETVSSIESVTSQVLPGFLRVPVDLHSLPVLTSRPTDGELSSPFGVRRDPIRKRRRRFHRGLDFDGKRGQPVHSAGPGVVVRARYNGGYGRVVFIDHGLGLQTRYAHLRRIHVSEGDFVPAGTLIGRVGSTGRSTGPHLHFEVRLRGAPVNPRLAMDTDLSGPSSWIGALASVFEPAAAPVSARARRAARRKARRSQERIPRSRRVRTLW